MTKSRYLKHKDVLDWWAAERNRQVWCSPSANPSDWCLSSEPNWYSEYHYVQDDEYHIYRKALAEGKTIQSRGESALSDWFDLGTTSHPYVFEYKFDEYRIKPEPAFNVGDYVTHSNGLHYRVTGVLDSGYICLARGVESEYSIDACSPEQLTKWQPEPGELCVFWDKPNHYSIGPYVMSSHIHFMQNKIDGFYNVAPLTFSLDIYKDN